MKSFYFPHDYDSRSNDSILPLREKFGAEGYGVYWMIVEILYQSGGMINENKIPAIAYEIHASLELVNSVIRDFELFCFEGGEFYSEGILNRLEDRENKRMRKVEAGRMGGLKSAKKRAEKRGVSKKQKNVAKKPTKKKYGSHVELTEEKYNELCQEYSPDKINSVIEDVNNYCTTHGKKYSSYAGAINTFLKSDGVSKKFDFSKYSDEELIPILKEKKELHAQASIERPHALFISQSI